MKTITPIKIVGKKKSLIDNIRHGINNATINCSIIKLVVESVEVLVYPNDNITKILNYVRMQTLINKIAMLEAK